MGVERLDGDGEGGGWLEAQCIYTVEGGGLIAIWFTNLEFSVRTKCEEKRKISKTI